MLDGQSKIRVGALLAEAHDIWRAQVRQALERRSTPALGAGAELLQHVTLAGVSQSLLADRLGTSKQAVQQSLDHLETLGLVRREADAADRRAKYVVLTEAGLYALEAQREAEREAERRLRDMLGDKRFARLRKTLARFSAWREWTP